MKKSNAFKIILVVFFIIVYILLLYYILSIQSNYKIVISTAQNQYSFSNEVQTDYVIPVVIENKANRRLNSYEQNVFISYHVYDANGNLIAYDNPRSRIEKEILSTDTGSVDMYISHLEKGEYIIEIDALEEGVTWFGKKEDTPHRINVFID